MRAAGHGEEAFHAKLIYGGFVEQLHIEAVLLAERGCILRQRLRRLLV